MGELVAAEVLRAVVTKKGLEAATQAAILGIPVKITHVGVTGTPGKPNEDMESLPGEVGGRLPIADGKVIAHNQVNISALLPDTFPTVNITGVAYYLADGTLFSVYLSQAPLLNHVQGATLLLGMDFVMDNIPSDSVIVESTGANLIMGDWVPVYRKVNGKSLTADIVLNAKDVKAAPEGFGLGESEAFTVTDMNTNPETWNGGKMGWFRGVTATLNKPGDQYGVGILSRYSAGSANLIVLIYMAANGRVNTRRWTGKTWDSWVTAYTTSHKPSASDVGAVPTARTVNGHALDKNITLTARDVGAMPSDANPDLSGYVPTDRKVNNKPLDKDVVLTASDVGALSNKGGNVDGGIAATGQIRARASSGFQTEADPNGVSAALSSESNFVMMWRRSANSAEKASEFVGIDHLSNLRFRRDNGVGDGKYHDLYVYHTGNKPTASDVGALPTANPTARDSFSVIATQQHIRLYESDNENKRWDIEANSNELRLVETGVGTRLRLLPGGGAELSGHLNAGEIRSKATQSYRMSDGVIGTFWRKDGDYLYLMRTEEGEAATGGFSSHRPFAMELKTGKIYTGNGLRVSGDLEMASSLVMGSRYLKGHNDAIVLRDHGAGTVTLSGGRNEDGTPGDLVIGYNGSASGTNGYNTKAVRLGGTALIANDRRELISASGKINGDELGHGAFQVLTDGNGIKHTIVGGADAVNRGRTIVASGEAGKQVADNNMTGAEDLHLASDTSEIWLHTGLESNWGGVHHRKVKIQGGEVYAQGDQRVYHPGNKPTASDVGALPTSGGDVLGRLRIMSSAPVLTLEETDHANTPYMLVVDGGNIRLNVRTTSALDADVVWKWSDTDKAFTTHGKLYAIGGLYDGSKRAYSDNNKPTPATLGCIGSDMLPAGSNWSQLLNKLVRISGNGGLEAGNYIDFHARDSEADYDARLEVTRGSDDVRKLHIHADDVTVKGTWKMYHQGFKPTASDVKALPADGDGTTTGNITARSFISTSTAGLRTAATSDGSQTVVKAESGFAMLAKENNSATKADEFIAITPASGLQFRVDDGTGAKKYKDFKVFHQGFKPTASDVGALSDKGGNLNGTLNIGAGFIIQHLGLTGSNKQLVSAHTDKVYLGNRDSVKQAFLQTNSGEAFVSVGASDHRIYHTGYKPTASDVKALSLDSGGEVKGVVTVPASSGLRTKAQGDGTSAAVSAEGGYAMLWKRNNSTTVGDEFIAIKASQLIFRQDLGRGDKGIADRIVYHSGNTHSHTAAEAMHNVLASAAYAEFPVGCTAMMRNKNYRDRAIQPGQHMKGSDLLYSNAYGTYVDGVPPGTWKSLGWAADNSAPVFEQTAIFIRIA